MQFKSMEEINVDVRIKKKHIGEKEYVWNSSIFENRKHLASIMNDSVIMCDEVIKSYDE